LPAQTDSYIDKIEMEVLTAPILSRRALRKMVAQWRKMAQ
jgi:hypothetical protein